MPRGGARPGAGRPRKERTIDEQINEALAEAVRMAPPAEEAQEPAADLPPPVPDGDPTQTPLDFLLAVMRNSKMPMQMRMNAAVNCAPYVHVKKGEAGKKEGAAAKAKETAKGTFRPSAPPQLRKVA